MIEQIDIVDLGVIAQTTLPLGPGFSAITGETGAGKTMVVTALGLLMGERSEASAVRSGGDRARVAGTIRTTNKDVQKIVEEAGGELDGDELNLVRTVSAEGRSRASVGGVGAPAQVLQRIAPHIFTVHGQSEQLRLRSQTAQREALDRFGGDDLLESLAAYKKVFTERAASIKELDFLQEEKLARVREAERLREELAEIDSAAPEEGEPDALRAKIERLSNIEELRQASLAARFLLEGDSEESQMSGATHFVASAARELERVAATDEKLQKLAREADSIGVQLDELNRELAEYSNSLDFEGPAELAEANARLEVLTSLTRKYGYEIADVLEYASEARKRLETLDSDDLRIEKLTAAVAELLAEQNKYQKELSTKRAKAAHEISEKVTAELRELAMPDAAFKVELKPIEPKESGAEAIEMLLAPHPGATFRPVAKSASGGELSRVMLAIEVVLAGRSSVSTFVFDEVDAGVGGQAAIEIGRRLRQLSKTAQVIVVTHLAQVAAFADNHLLVQKDSAGGFTRSSCVKLEGQERLSEMARLLSGMSDSKSALEHAAELLNL